MTTFLDFIRKVAQEKKEHGFVQKGDKDKEGVWVTIGGRPVFIRTTHKPRMGEEAHGIGNFSKATTKTQKDLAVAMADKKIKNLLDKAGNPKIKIADSEKGWGTGLAQSGLEGIELSRKLSEKASKYKQTVNEVIGHELGHRIGLTDSEKFEWRSLAPKVKLHGIFDPMALTWGSSRDGEAWGTAVGKWAAQKELDKDVMAFVGTKIQGEKP